MAERERYVLKQVERRVAEARTEIMRDMQIAEDCGLAYTGLTLTQLKIAAKGWKRAAQKRAIDLTLKLGDFPLYVDATYTPPSLERYKAKLAAKASPLKRGKYWSAFSTEVLEGQKGREGKEGKEG